MAGPVPATDRIAAEDDWIPRLRETTARATSATALKKRKTITCNTCSESLLPSSFAPTPPSASCGHGILTCRTCMQRWFKNQMDTHFFDDLRCPACYNILNATELKAAMDSKTFAKWENISSRVNLSKQPGWHWCLQVSCDSGQVFTAASPCHAISDTGNPAKKRKTTRSGAGVDPTTDPSKDDVAFTCVKCGLATCTACEKPWHEGETCSEHQRRMSKESTKVKKSERAIKKIGKLCPGRDCARWIEKDGGCSHMQCIVCHTNFCWLCLGVFDGATGNAHRPDCPQRG